MAYRSFSSSGWTSTLTVWSIVCLFSTGCSGPSGGVTGTIEGAENAAVRLAVFEQRGFQDIDTVMADDQGAFHIEAEALRDLALDIYKVNVDDSHFFILGDSLSSLTVKGSMPDEPGLITTLAVTGDQWTAGFTDFLSGMTARQDSMAAAKVLVSNGTTTEEKIQAKRDYEALQERLTRFVRNTIREHKNDPIGLMALEHINMTAERTLAQQVIDSTRTLMGHSMAHRTLSQRVSKQRKPRQTQGRNAQIKPGMAMPDITLQDPDGQSRSLSDLRGKVVLVDFWASWCGPCRRENPNVVRAWNEYNKRGFEVFSISLDKDASKWKRAIEQDGLIWPYHISDLRGWNSVASAQYGISSIPHAILIDKDGTVVATHLRGNQLEAELEKLL